MSHSNHFQAQEMPSLPPAPPNSPLLPLPSGEEGTQWIVGNEGTQIPVVKAAAALNPVLRSDIILSLPTAVTTASPTSRGSTTSHHFLRDPDLQHFLKEFQAEKVLESKAMKVSVPEVPVSPFSQSYSLSADESVLNSLKRLREKERSTINSRKALAKENETLKQKLSALESKLKYTSQQPRLQSSRPHSLALPDSELLSRQLNPPLVTGPLPNMQAIAALGLIGQNIPKPDGVSTLTHQGRLLDRLATAIGRQEVPSSLSQISGMAKRGFTKGKSWVKDNQALIIRVGIIILVISLAPALLPLLGI